MWPNFNDAAYVECANAAHCAIFFLLKQINLLIYIKTLLLEYGMDMMMRKSNTIDRYVANVLNTNT